MKNNKWLMLGVAFALLPNLCYAAHPQPIQGGQTMSDKVKEVPVDVAKLDELFRYELAARKAYQDVIDQIEETDKKEKINEFLKQHEEHIKSLSDVLTKLTGERPNETRDVSGVLLGAYATVRKITGQKGALEALHTAEKGINDKYEEVLKHSFSEDIKKLLTKNYDQEKNHLNVISKWLGRTN